MEKPKTVVLDDGLDPLSSNKPSSGSKKANNATNFENLVREQERAILGSNEQPGQKKTEFVIKKNLSSNTAAEEIKIKSVETKNPFASVQPISNRTTNTNETNTVILDKAESEYAHLNNKSAQLKFENFGITEKEIFPGEAMVCPISCTLVPMQYPNLVAEGYFIVTNARVLFKPRDAEFLKKNHLKEDYFTMPLGFINKYEKTTDRKNPNLTFLDLYGKDGRIFKLRMTGNVNEPISLVQYLNLYAFPEKKEYFFAFDYGKSESGKNLEDKYKGWKIYDIEAEFKRQGIDFEPLSESKPGTLTSRTYKVIDNRFFRICSTYPPLLLVPAKVPEQAILASSKFRTRERLPVVTYYYSKTKTILARSSQSKPGLVQNRCAEDEILLRNFGNPFYNESTDTGITQIDLLIYDARPYLSAMANKVNGKGFEDTKWYKNCEINFMDIENIHHVRESHKKLLNLCFSPDVSGNKWYSQLESSGWLDIISYIVKAANQVAHSLKKGKNCLVHCSDGWDRTAQILSLTQIMLDPYFRTMEGFEVLIEKEWVSFGHQFNLRMGHGNRNDKDEQRSPVFLQFIDCVQQLLHQYPFAFEFNDRFLCDIIYHAYSCQFGTFLCNSFQEMNLYQVSERTVSIWSYLNSQKEKYLNIYYIKNEEIDNLTLRPSGHHKYLRLWEEYFLNYSQLSRPICRIYQRYNGLEFQRDFYEYMYAKEKSKVKELKNEIETLKRKLKESEMNKGEEENKTDELLRQDDMETSEKLKIENEIDDQEENYEDSIKKEYPENIDAALLESEKKYDD